MAYSEEMFQEILDDDVLVDREKLSNVSYYGVPEKMRSKVWVFLLSDANHNFEEQQETKIYNNLSHAEFPHIKNTVNTVIHRMALVGLNNSAGLSNILCSYFSCNPNVHFQPGIASMLVPIYISSGENEVSSFFMLASLLDKWIVNVEIEKYYEYTSKLSKYISISLPDLANHFSAESLDMNDVFLNWFHYLHSTSLPLPCLSRLWDTYLSLVDNNKIEILQDTVLFVSLALVDSISQKLMRMEHIEIKNFLNHLPNIDIDILLIQAQTLKHSLSNVFSGETKVE